MTSRILFRLKLGVRNIFFSLSKMTFLEGNILTNIFKAIIKAIIKYSQKVDLVIEGIVLLCLSKLDLLGILESACIGSTDGNSRRAVFWIRSKQRIFPRNIRNSNRMDKLVYCSYYFEFESR